MSVCLMNRMMKLLGTLIVFKGSFGGEIKERFIESPFFVWMLGRLV